MPCCIDKEKAQLVGGQPDDQSLAPLDRDRYRRHLAEPSELGEDARKLSLGMPDHPSLEHCTVVSDQAHAVLG